jgi:carbamoyl-phosphate synthase large subunit
MTTEEALKAANELGYPVLIRPSYVLGGQNMIIAYADEDVTEYMGIILRTARRTPVLIDKYLWAPRSRSTRSATARTS